MLGRVAMFLTDTPLVDFSALTKVVTDGAKDVATGAINMATGVTPYVIGVAGVGIVIGVGISFLKSIRK